MESYLSRRRSDLLTRRPYRTVLVGLGKIGAGYADDHLTAPYYKYATHAQVLRDHPRFSWDAVVDHDAAARRAAEERWHIPHVAAGGSELPESGSVEVAVLATPPGSRTEILAHLPGLRAVVVEKPLGRTAAESEQFLEVCERREIAVQVNLWRRADQAFRDLGAGGLERRIGRPQAAFAVYGNGLINNGLHLVDFVRMLLGDVKAVQGLAGPHGPHAAGPVAGDVQLPFSLSLQGGSTVMFAPLRFEHYRENGLEIWGEQGRLAIRREGLALRCYSRRPHRALSGADEMDTESPESIASTVGEAFYHLYDNLAQALDGRVALWSPGRSALRSERIVEAVLKSARAGGTSVAC